MTGIEAFWRAIATIVIWTMVVGGFALTGIFMADALGDGIVMVVFLLLGAAVASTGFVWNWGNMRGSSKVSWHDWGEQMTFDETRTEKRKADRISAALRNLSDDELVRLRQRIARGEITDEDLEAALAEERDQIS